MLQSRTRARMPVMVNKTVPEPIASNDSERWNEKNIWRSLKHFSLAVSWIMLSATAWQTHQVDKLTSELYELDSSQSMKTAENLGQYANFMTHAREYDLNKTHELTDWIITITSDTSKQILRTQPKRDQKITEINNKKIERNISWIGSVAAILIAWFWSIASKAERRTPQRQSNQPWSRIGREEKGVEAPTIKGIDKNPQDLPVRDFTQIPEVAVTPTQWVVAAPPMLEPLNETRPDLTIDLPVHVRFTDSESEQVQLIQRHADKLERMLKLTSLFNDEGLQEMIDRFKERTGELNSDVNTLSSLDDEIAIFREYLVNGVNISPEAKVGQHNTIDFLVNKFKRAIENDPQLIGYINWNVEQELLEVA